MFLTEVETKIISKKPKQNKKYNINTLGNMQLKGVGEYEARVFQSIWANLGNDEA